MFLVVKKVKKGKQMRLARDFGVASSPPHHPMVIRTNLLVLFAVVAADAGCHAFQVVPALTLRSNARVVCSRGSSVRKSEQNLVHKDFSSSQTATLERHRLWFQPIAENMANNSLFFFISNALLLYLVLSLTSNFQVTAHFTRITIT